MNRLPTGKAAATWTGSLSHHVFPVFGGKAIRDIDTQDVLAVLPPIWTEKIETAGRIRGRIERILDYAVLKSGVTERTQPGQ